MHKMIFFVFRNFGKKSSTTLMIGNQKRSVPAGTLLLDAEKN